MNRFLNLYCYVLSVLAFLISACGGARATPQPARSEAGNAASGTGTVNDTNSASVKRLFKGEAWADNWFQAYLDDRSIAEDSVSISTTKSFNSATFTFEGEYPLHLGFILKDYIENDSGLEYIGTSRQQIGDGGFIFQLTDVAADRVVMTSTSAWRCFPIHRAPLNPSCVTSSDPISACQFQKESEPTGWHSPDFDDSVWPLAHVFSAAEVGPKEGYWDVRWGPQSEFIWSSDLRVDNTVLCRVTVYAP